MSTNQGIITDVFPPKERGKALGISGSFVALGSILGPALGGFIVTYFTWHYIFLINVPIGIICYIFAKIIETPVKNNPIKVSILLPILSDNVPLSGAITNNTIG